MQALEELEKAKAHLEKAHDLLSEQTPKPGHESSGYKTGWAIHWTNAEIKKLRREKEE